MIIPALFLYEDSDLKVIFTSAGRIVKNVDGSTVLWKYEYNLTDHLGNARAEFAVHSNGIPELMQHTDYYPFGMVMNQQEMFKLEEVKNRYLYNGKELQDDNIGISLDWYDYGARFYDPELGRWHTVDPLAEDYYSISPYNYVANNPMIYIDPTWMALDNYTVDEQENVKLEEETKDKFEMLYAKSDWKAGNKDNGLKVNDKSILPDLADNRTGSNGNYAISTNKDENFNVFFFMANYTNVEWGIDGYRTSGEIMNML